MLEQTCTYQCHGCSNLFAAKKKYENHLKVCTKIPSVIYKFKNQNLVTFEDHFKDLGDLPLVVYFDFEATTGSGLGNYLNDEKIYPISYCIFSLFIQKLDIKRTVVFTSFQQTLELLNNIRYLNHDVTEEVANQL